MPIRHRERHRTEQSGWLRATVLGANDGILSTASLVLSVAAAHGSRSSVLIAGTAGLAAGEYVSVHSHSDTEQADLAKERAELRTNDQGNTRNSGRSMWRVASIPRLRGKWRINSWPITPCARMLATNSASPTH